MKIKDRPALILNDLQKGLEVTDFYSGHRNNPKDEVNAKKLLFFFGERVTFLFFTLSIALLIQTQDFIMELMETNSKILLNLFIMNQ
jgi:hypothetical protein